MELRFHESIKPFVAFNAAIPAPPVRIMSLKCPPTFNDCNFFDNRCMICLRLRPNVNSFIEISIDQPYEVHLVEFSADEDFKNFMLDEERKKILHLKEQSIKAVVLIKGTKL